VAVPILSLIAISVDELWVKPLEQREALAAPPDLDLPPVEEPRATA
jgi:hypothetical protein